MRETAEQMKPMDKFQEEGRLKSASKDPAVDELTKDNASSTEKERFTTQAREMDFERIKVSYAVPQPVPLELTIFCRLL